jgi:alkanesulfonate monooxygenase SsuD/methylene tetrahydromethanopterin reductase-like flavin-dependent oxidoreductase (luciferase family)
MALSILRLDMRAPSFSPASAPELYAAALDMAAWADEKGFDLISLSEHHATDDGFLPSPIAMAGCIAGRTRRIRIGIIALLLPLYDPVKLAEDLAVLDLASGGRVGLTAGIGYRPEEYAMFGRDFGKRGALMDENLDVLLRAWRGEEFEYGGRRVKLSPLPASQPHPFLTVGGTGRKGALRAARFGLPFQPAIGTPELLELYRSECERLGHDPVMLPPGSGHMTWVSEDPDRTWAEIGPYLLHDATTYASWQPPGHRSAVHSDADTIDAMRAEGKYRVLTPDECVEAARAEGPGAVMLHFPLCGGTPPDLGWKSLELYAEKVLPRLTPPS